MDDIQRAADLRKMQHIATGLLVAMTLLFVITSAFEGQVPWLAFVRAFAEAAMIGALADWFAVTALFRHPLGLPIPHTAIIPERKGRIAVNFGSFVERNFIDPDRIVERLRRQDVAGRLARLMRQPERAAQIADVAAEGLGGLLRVANDEDVGQVLARGFSERLDAVPAAPMIGRLLGAAAEDQRQREILVQLVEVATGWIETNQDSIRKRIAGELPIWLPSIVDQKIYEKLLDAARRTLNDLHANPNHPLYDQFTATVDTWIQNLQHDPQVRARGEEIKSEVLAQPVVREIAGSVWQDLKASLLLQSSTPDSQLRRSIAAALAHLGDALERDPDWRAKVNGWSETLVRYLVRRYGRATGEFITHTVNGWDTADTVRKIELQFGRDLQFIRINGTIVGGLAGLVIYSVSLLLK
ncbi:MAG TPA: DUF445 domain-containing protein [Roseiflexaceae bacterium]|nr:DUF445 domain-containing protein [Roseiflexaceae bacterium]